MKDAGLIQGNSSNNRECSMACKEWSEDNCPSCNIYAAHTLLIYLYLIFISDSCIQNFESATSLYVSSNPPTSKNKLLLIIVACWVNNTMPEDFNNPINFLN